MRLHEIHPMTTHFGVAFLPVAVGVDLAARITDRDDLYRLGRITMPACAATTWISAATGLVAEQEVQGGPRAQSMLRTHKTLNLTTGAVLTALSVYRLRRRRPGWGYSAGGLASLGTLAYSAYLGGQMVYTEGLGVERADGVRRSQAPRLRPGNFTRAISTLGRQLKRGFQSLIRVLLPRFDEPVDDDYVRRRLRSDNDRPGALPLGATP